MTGQLPTHSPLGASGTHRWIECPGSVGLGTGIVDIESDHAALGTAAHTVAAKALETGQDAWVFVGQKVPDSEITVDKPMADAVQVYLDAVHLRHAPFQKDRQHGIWIEHRFHCPTIHPLFYGHTDLSVADFAKRELHVWDYKHGAGIVVEVERNPQEMYYAAGILESLELWQDIDKVFLHISQPRGFHYDGPNRTWGCTVEQLIEWLEDELIPAMTRAEVSRDTKSGEHCRFCPVRSHACPQLMSDMDEMERMVKVIQSTKEGAKTLTNEQVGRFLDLVTLAKIVGKAAEETAFSRLQSGNTVPGYKLGKKKVYRAWKDDAEPALKAKFGDDAYTLPELKSPAAIEELPEGETMATRWAFKPEGGLTVIKASDSRPAVNKDVKSMFKPVKKGGKK